MIMKLLWITPKIADEVINRFHLPLKSNPLGGWIDFTVKKILSSTNNDIILCAENSGIPSKFSYGKSDKLAYYLINTANISNELETILDKELPDIVHVFGTESIFVRSCANVCCECGYQDRTIIWIQGLKYAYAEHYFGGISDKSICFPTVRDIVRKDSLLRQHCKFKLEGEQEKELLRKIQYVTGRTEWDYVHSTFINPQIHYYKVNETMREKFYESRWDISKIEKFSVFVSQSHYPIKGFHWLLKAIAQVKEYYPQVKVYVSGSNNSFVSGMRKTGYGRYIQQLISDLKINDNIHYVGMLSQEEMISRYLQSNVFVSPSAIENSPNSVCEAMLLGMPVISSTVGGVNDLINHKKEGYLYQYDAPYLLANYICRIFNDERLAIEMGCAARERALSTHNPERNFNDLMEVYNDIWRKVYPERN